MGEVSSASIPALAHRVFQARTGPLWKAGTSHQRRTTASRPSAPWRIMKALSAGLIGASQALAGGVSVQKTGVVS